MACQQTPAGRIACVYDVRNPIFRSSRFLAAMTRPDSTFAAAAERFLTCWLFGSVVWKVQYEFRPKTYHKEWNVLMSGLVRESNEQLSFCRRTTILQNGLEN